MCNMQAIFTDPTSNFVKPYNPKTGDTVKFTICVGYKEFTKVEIIMHDTASKTDIVYEMYNDYEKRKEMIDLGNSKNFDYYSADVAINSISYYFYKLTSVNRETIYYNWLGAQKDYNFIYNFMIVPDFIIPEWSRGANMYQIFVDRFCNGNNKNGVVIDEYMYKPAEFGRSESKLKKQYVTVAEDWYDFPEKCTTTQFYNGDLQGVIDKLDYLEGLGIEAIYFNPIFLSPSNHKYDIMDYKHIDPHIGVIVEDDDRVLPDNALKNTESPMYVKRITSEANLKASNMLFAKLVEEAHKRGIKVILDGVFNHRSAYGKEMDRGEFYSELTGVYGAYELQNSPYKNYFLFFQNNWNYNDVYDCYGANNGIGGFKEEPKIYYEGDPCYNGDPKSSYLTVQEKEMIEVAQMWLKPPYNADGWRLDVAASVGCSREFNHRFWKNFRKAVKEANSEAIIIAEHYEVPTEWLDGKQWDTLMSYKAFMEAVRYFFTGMDKHCKNEIDLNKYGNSEDLINTLTYHMSRMPMQSLETAMIQLSNHDHSRFMTSTNGIRGTVEERGPSAANFGINKGIYKEATVFMMTFIGCPTIYYGDEAGVCGWTDPDNRRTYPWGYEDMSLLKFHEAISKIRKSHNCLKVGSLKFLLAEKNVLAYARFTKEEKAIMVFNNEKTLFKEEITIPVWPIGIDEGTKMKVIFKTNVASFKNTEKELTVNKGEIKISMPAYSAAIIVTESDLI